MLEAIDFQVEVTWKKQKVKPNYRRTRRHNLQVSQFSRLREKLKEKSLK